ncbi:MAG TPA: hypothetical protein VGC66_22020 [Pyrinomonadaceae bacterium]|jgi:hypothetical protein
MNERTLNLPGKYSRDEIDSVLAAAAKLNMTPTDYVRKRLKLSPVKMGAPRGNKNNPQGRRASKTFQVSNPSEESPPLS